MLRIRFEGSKSKKNEIVCFVQNLFSSGINVEKNFRGQERRELDFDLGNNESDIGYTILCRYANTLQHILSDQSFNARTNLQDQCGGFTVEAI